MTFFIIVFGLILAIYQHKLKDASQLDFLTKIYNRNKFYEIVKNQVKYYQRYDYVRSASAYQLLTRKIMTLIAKLILQMRPCIVPRKMEEIKYVVQNKTAY